MKVGFLKDRAKLDEVVTGGSLRIIANTTEEGFELGTLFKSLRANRVKVVKGVTCSKSCWIQFPLGERKKKIQRK